MTDWTNSPVSLHRNMQWAVWLVHSINGVPRMHTRPMPWHQPARDRAFKGKCGRKIASPRRETARPLLDARLFDRRFELRRRPSQPKQHWDFINQKDD
jgi:hypothetical protein